MAVYKIPQDVEADDKFVGPLSFKQFIYGGICAICLYVSFLGFTHQFPYLFILFSPIIIASGFLAWPWSREQPTEIWLAAKIRFLIKPRVRIWNQSGVKELVTVTAPLRIAKTYTDGLTVNEVSSRLTGLADLLDSRGWAVKNVGPSVYSPIIGQETVTTDRLVTVSAAPQEVNDASSANDVLDINSSQTAIHFEEMIKNSEQKHRQDVLQTLETARTMPQTPTAQQPATGQNSADFWFLQKGGTHPTGSNFQSNNNQYDPNLTTFDHANIINPMTAGQIQNIAPSPVSNISPMDEKALLEKIHHMPKQPIAYGHMKTIQPLGQQGMAGDNSQQPVHTAATLPSTPTYTQAKPADTQQYYAQPLDAVDPEYTSYQAPMPSTPTATPTNYAGLVPQTNPINQPPQAVTPPVDPAIIKLASNNDLNVATLARQAHKEAADGEVIISLR
jgi:hypothetical protein